MMKKLLHIKILAAIVFSVLFTGSAYSQNIISSVNTTATATDISEKLINKKVESISIKLNPENWLSNKSYLESGSSIANLKILMAANERIIEPNSEIEEWMFESNYWNILNPVTSIDHNQEIEEWMFAKSFWAINNSNEAIEIENWMIDKEFWVIDK